MKRCWAWTTGTGRWSALLALAAAAALLAAVACGGEEDDATGPAATDTGAATTDATAGGDTMTATAPEPSNAVGHEVGMLAPDFTVETVGGESFSLSEATGAGSPVLLYFFATW